MKLYPKNTQLQKAIFEQRRGINSEKFVVMQIRCAASQENTDRRIPSDKRMLVQNPHYCSKIT